MVSLDTQAAILAALSSADANDAIDGVKRAVLAELEALDPTADIEPTQYFNHSYVPDFVINWSEGGRSEPRPVFLRPTVHSALMSGDVKGLAASGPIILTLKPDGRDTDALTSAREDVESSSRLLLTAVPALDRAISPQNADERSPLLPLVRHSIVRGARGVLDQAAVDEVTSSAAPTSDVIDSGSALTRFTEIVGQIFVEDAALRLRRSAELLRVGLSANADELLANASTDARGVLSGELSSAELHSLLPYLLSRPDVTRSVSFWRRVGSMMDLDSLESMASELYGVDLGPLVVPNLADWAAARAGLVGVAEGEQLARGAVEEGWRIEAGLVSLFVGGWRMHVSANGRRIRGRTDSPSARWADLAPTLDGFRLASVRLRGVTRFVDVGSASAEDVADVQADVRVISESIEDDFFVPHAAVRDRELPGELPVVADFTRMVAFVEGKAPARSVARVALQLLGYRYPVENDDLRRLLYGEVDEDEDSEEA